jgi:ethanolamine-phosphate cytidylyltransferase
LNSIFNHLTSLFTQIDIVCYGVESPPAPDPITGGDPFEVPKALGKYVEVDGGNDMTTSKIIERIISHR